MSQEVFEMVLGMDKKSIETQLALQCAPLITGLKIANLLIVSAQNEKMVFEMLRRSGICCYCMIRTSEKSTFLLFRKEQLEEVLSDRENREFLKQEGYQGLEIGKTLRRFQLRYQAYMAGEKQFPHEMGLLLGYPLEDVVGFMEHRGKNFLYSGYWKVYAKKSEKMFLFQKFEHAKETLIQLVAEGICMEDIIRQYSGNQPLFSRNGGN